MGSKGLNVVFLCLLGLLESLKPFLGQFGELLDLNSLFVSFLVLLDSVKPVLGKFMVG